jgi:glyceraldehyde 3-phosphate dehydrogenase
MHKKYRGRAAALNMVITETGVGRLSKSVTVIGRKTDFKCNWVLVPNGSLVTLRSFKSKLQ